MCECESERWGRNEGDQERERDDVGGDPEKEGPPRYDCNPFAYIDGDSWYHSSNDLSHPSGNATRLPTRALVVGLVEQTSHTYWDFSCLHELRFVDAKSVMFR